MSVCRICSFSNLQNMKVVGLPATSRTRCAKFGGTQNDSVVAMMNDCTEQNSMTGHLPWAINENETCLMSWFLATII
jgi:hypothetical protein